MSKHGKQPIGGGAFVLGAFSTEHACKLLIDCAHYTHSFTLKREPGKARKRSAPGMFSKATNSFRVGSVKTLIIGQEGSGKTSVVTKFKTGKFSGYSTRRRESYGFIGDKKGSVKSPGRNPSHRSIPLGFLSMLPDDDRSRINTTEENRSYSSPSGTSPRNLARSNPDSSSDESLTMESPKEAPPSAFGFLDLLEDDEKKKMQELNSKVAPKQTRFNLHISMDSKEIPWNVKSCCTFENAPKMSSISGIIFVFNLTDVESFLYVSKLLEEYFTTKSQNQHHATLLIGTQADCDCEVKSILVKDLMKKYSICYYPCSAKSNLNIQNLFASFTAQVLFQKFYYPRWISIRSSLKDKLSLAVIARNTTRVKQLLATDPRSPSALLKCDWSLIHVAAWEGFFECLFLFIQYEPNCVNSVNSLGWTPLHIASRMGHLYIVEYLLEAGADPCVTDKDNLTPLDTNNSQIRSLVFNAQENFRKNKAITSMSHIQTRIKRLGSTLTVLDLSHAKLCVFPPEILECSQLIEINLSSNMIKDIAKDYSKLCNLTKLRFFQNEVIAIPESLTQLQKLETLDLRHNKVVGITPSIANIKTLKRLLISYNLLTYLPGQIADMDKTLEVFSIYGNPLTTLPPDVIPRLGDVHPLVLAPLMAYLRNISVGGKEEYNRVKVMFVGDGNVGKTSLLNCFIEKDKRRSKLFSVPSSTSRENRSGSVTQTQSVPDPTDTIATDGIDIDNVTIPLPGGKEMIWDCWDYAGQEIYYATHQFFLSPRSVYLICFNLLDRDLSKVEYWINSIHSRARGSPMFLIGTHVDDKACTDEYVDDFINRLIQTIKPDRFRNKLGIQSIKGIHALSCKKRTGIRELMEDISEIIQKARFVGQLFPSSWLKLEQTLGTLRNTSTPILNWKEFERIAIGCHIEEDSVKEAAKYLHMIGVLCFFDDPRSGLDDLVILDPQFLTNVMSAIVTLKHRYGTEGVIYKKDLLHVWKEFPRNLHSTLMNLLERFDIAHCLPDKATGTKKYIIPCLLPDATPDLSEYWSLSLNKKIRGLVFSRVYRFAFLPLGFCPRLFVRNMHLPNMISKIQWANGQLLEFMDGSSRALIRYNPTTYVLHLQVHGPLADVSPKEYNNTIRMLRILVENIETTIEGWYECKVNVVIPCSHCLMEGNYSQWEFALEDCMESIARNQAFVLCRNVRKIRLDVLAPDLSLADLKSLHISFDNIEIGRAIGEGAFGIVCKGIYNGESVAIKQLADDDYDDDDESTATGSFGFSEQTLTYSEEKEDLLNKFVEFQREVWLMSCLNHRNVCSLRGICTSPMAMVMDYLELGDLFHLIGKVDRSANRKGRTIQPNSPSNLLNFNLKVKIAYDIAEGMNHLHTFEPPIIHRDLRSPNIFVKTLDINAPVCALVGDFGLSRLFASSLAGGAFNRNWLAPEVMKGEDYSGSMDVYSFAIIVWELVTLRRPFEEYDDTFNGKPASFFKKAVIEGLRPTIPNSCDPVVSELIKNCWDGEPNNRPSFQSIIETLKELMNELEIPICEEIKKVAREDDSMFAQRLTVNTPDDYVVATLKQSLTHDIEDVGVQTMIMIGNSLAWCAISNGTISVWDARLLRHIRTITVSEEKIYSMLNIQNELAWIADAVGHIFVYSVEGKKMYSLREHSTTIRTMVVVENNSDPKKSIRTIWTGDIDGNIIIWRSCKKKKSKVKQRIKINYCIGSMVQIGLLVAVGTSEGRIILLDANTGTIESEWTGHTSLVNNIIVHNDLVWSCSNDGCILVWEPCANDPIVHPLQGHASRVYCLVEHGGFIWAGSFDKTISIWDPRSFTLVQELKGHKDGIRCMMSTNFNTVWSGSMDADGSIGVWECKDSDDSSLLVRVTGKSFATPPLES